MGSFFSQKKEGTFPLEKDPDAALDAAAAAAAPPAPNDSGCAPFTEPAVPAGQQSVTTLARVADAAGDAGGERVAAGEHAKSG